MAKRGVMDGLRKNFFPDAALPFNKDGAIPFSHLFRQIPALPQDRAFSKDIIKAVFSDIPAAFAALADLLFQTPYGGKLLIADNAAGIMALNI